MVQSRVGNGLREPGTSRDTTDAVTQFSRSAWQWLWGQSCTFSGMGTPPPDSSVRLCIGIDGSTALTDTATNIRFDLWSPTSHDAVGRA